MTTISVMNRPLTAGSMVVEPLWDVNHNDTHPCVIETNVTGGKIIFSGSDDSICELHIVTSNGSHAKLQIANISRATSFHIQRIGTLDDCFNKYVAFNNDNCTTTLIHDDIQMVLQGTADFIITEVKTSLSKCPEDVHFDQNQLQNCKNVKGYNHQILCDPSIRAAFKINLPPNCCEILGTKEVDYEICDIGMSVNITGMILYPNHMTILDLRHNDITKLRSKSFQSSLYLEVLLLDYNQISAVNDDAFWGLTQLVVLDMADNNLTTLSSRLFTPLINLITLHLEYNKLATLPLGIFDYLVNLEALILANNRLVTLHEAIFVSLSNLRHLHLYSNKLKVLPGKVFRNKMNLIELSISMNELVMLDEATFANLTSLVNLHLYNNKLSDLPETIFQNLTNLSTLFLNTNYISTLPGNLFKGLANLKHLFLESCHIQKISSGSFSDLINLEVLLLTNNQLIHFEAQIFHKLRNLLLLSLHNNKISTVEAGIFDGVLSVQYLALSSNKITELVYRIFHGLQNLIQIQLGNNRLAYLPSDIFQDNIKLQFIDLSGNKLTTIPTINHLVHLNFMNLRNNSLTEVGKDTFKNISTDLELFVDQQEICECYVPPRITCSAADPRSPYLSCDRLLSDRTLVVVMWLIGLNAFCGNLFVLVWRKQNIKMGRKENTLLGNLAIADFLMGLYMLIIASADLYFGVEFPLKSETWRSSITCRLAGALSIISSEASVFFVTLISVDRFISIRFPYSSRKFSGVSVKVIAAFTWTMAIILGIVPSVLSRISFKFYDKSHVCIGLPLSLTKVYSTTGKTSIETITFGLNIIHYPKNTFTTEFKGLANGLYFSTAVFLGLNCVCYLIILGCYVEIVRAVNKSSKESKRTRAMNEQIKLTTKVTAIVATDFCCWFPIIILGILVQARVITLPPSIYAWCVTFVLPINSAINPYLYTIAEVVSKYRSRKRQDDEQNTQQMSMTQLNHTNID